MVRFDALSAPGHKKRDHLIFLVMLDFLELGVKSLQLIISHRCAVAIWTTHTSILQQSSLLLLWLENGPNLVTFYHVRDCYNQFPSST